MMSKEARSILLKFYASLRKARRLRWHARITSTGAIRLSPPGMQTCYCIVTAAYRIRSGKYATVIMGIDKATQALGLDTDIYVTPARIWPLSSVFIEGSDKFKSEIRHTYPWGADKIIQVRRTLFGILGLPLSRL